MHAPRKIVVGTDFSEAADRAVLAAVAFAKRVKAEVHLVHALEVLPPPVTPYALTIPDELIGAARETALRKLEDAQERIRAQGIDGAVSLGTIPAARAIAERATELGATLVVVGSRGNTGLKRMLLGSVAEHTVQSSPVSVLTVRGGGNVAAPRAIVVGFDFSADAKRAVELAADWARAFEAQLHLVHGLQLPMPFVGPYEIAVPDGYVDPGLAEARQRLDALAAELTGVKVRTAVILGPAHDAIDTVAQRVGADLIVTGSRGLGGVKHLVLGSVAERTLRHAPCSVLTVKAPLG